MSRQILERLRGLPAFVMNICPEANCCFRAYCISARHSLLGRKMVRILPLQLTTARPALAASIVMNCSSETRIPVAQMVWRTNDSRSFPSCSAARTRRRYSSRVSSFSSPQNRLLCILSGLSLKSNQPAKLKKH